LNQSPTEKQQQNQLRIGVLVTSYGRAPYLEKCINSLLTQQRPPDEIVIVTREGDTETVAYVTKLMERNHSGPTQPCDVTIRHGIVTEPGVLQANRVGIELITADIVAFLDDDATAYVDWIQRIHDWFAERPLVGAVGGRDIIHKDNPVKHKSTQTVGKITWYGRVIGKHECVFAGSTECDHLKGVNMSFRRSLIGGFDHRIAGNAHHYEMDMCFAVRKQGYTVMFDGDLLVDHYQDAPRHLPGYQQHRASKRDLAFFIHHNRAYVMMKNLSTTRRLLFLAYAFVWDPTTWLDELVGNREDLPAVWFARLRGNAAGLRTYVKSRFSKS